MTNWAVSAVILENPKQLENINTAANEASSEPRCAVTGIKSEWFDMELDAGKRL